ncbi:N-acetyltransferase [Kangiella sp. HD9-110m-PIT-SAG07]|nr:N-acetyltransferase [Kangiella sp. HD9-110m-PIT-SAG07]
MIIYSNNKVRLRHIETTDAAFILDLYNQPAFIKHIGDRGVHDLEAAAAFIQSTQEHYNNFGFWLYLVEDKKSGTPVGVNGLLQRNYLEFPDIGFAISKHHWGRGYAYQSSLAVLEHAANLKLPEVLAITSEDNKSSIALLSKLKFTDEGKQIIPDNDESVNLYRKVIR